MCDNFLCNVLANFFPDLLIGILLGSILALYIGKQLTRFEQIQQKKNEEINNINRAIHYLKLINDEINSNLDNFPELIEIFQTKEVIDQKIELMILTPFWDSIKPSGELPKLLDPGILSSITEFYEYTSFVKRVMNRFFPNSKSNIYGWSTFTYSSQEGLKKAQETGSSLPNMIDQETKGLKKKLEDLNN